MKVLLLEDNPQNIESLKTAILTACPNADITVLTEVGASFYKGSEYNEAVQLASYDAVITDVNMPGYTDRDGMIMSPIGPIIALKALQQGVKRIAVLTDANHHEASPISKSADLFRGFHSELGFNGDCVIGDIKLYYENTNKLNTKYQTDTLRWLFSETKDRVVDWLKKNP
ncbi:response regulator [Candidatus Nomurabacteria bacterium]|nr:response regulator [Patescibacteria group bacterium]MCB9820776.1 response regulator [Candidatus Nomurabacteria bacterium]